MVSILGNEWPALKAYQAWLAPKKHSSDGQQKKKLGGFVTVAERKKSNPAVAAAVILIGFGVLFRTQHPHAGAGRGAHKSPRRSSSIVFVLEAQLRNFLAALEGGKIKIGAHPEKCETVSGKDAASKTKIERRSPIHSNRNAL